MKNQVEQPFKEVMLSKELEDVKLKIKESDQKIKQLKNDNSEIKKYIYQLQLENEEYLTYSSNKEPSSTNTNNGGTGNVLILSSGEHYKNEVDLLKKENDLIMEKHSQEFSNLKNLLTEKDKECKRISRQLDSLENVKALKKELSTKCEQLEQDLKLLKVSNAEEIDSLKVKLAMDSKELKETCSTTINGVSKHIDQQAKTFMSKESERIKEENDELRQELIMLIRRSQALHRQILRLKNMKVQLVRPKMAATVATDKSELI